MTHPNNGDPPPPDPAARRHHRDTEHEPVPPRLCEGYEPPSFAWRDRETGQWFAYSFDMTAGSVKHGPFATEDEARAVLTGLLGDPAK